MNNEQLELHKKLALFLRTKSNREFLITGLAGSGKTTTVSNYFLNQNIYKNEEILILTPTHKAKFVINKKTKGFFDYGICNFTY